MSIVWSLSIVRPNGYFSLELHRQRINCVREDTRKPLLASSSISVQRVATRIEGSQQ